MDDDKKVGIITLFGRFNYGNRLQNYATSKIWSDTGFIPETLVLESRPNVIKSAKAFARRILGRKIYNPESLMSEDRLKSFDYFNRNMRIRFLTDITPELKDEYTLFSVGSDQVWNPSLIVYDEDWYFLEFARPEQRIALAPSVGLDAVDRRQARKLAHGVRGFTNPSVREQRGAELIKECSGINAEVICDPTLVLSETEWRAIADSRLTPTEPYVFTYLLGGVSEDAQRVLCTVTGNNKIPVISLSDREKTGELPAGPAEFIDLISHASHVVTDSYHAAVFSCLMKTPLTIVRRSGDGGGMFSRLETLAETLGIQSKVVGLPEFDLSKAGDYFGIDERINAERQRFRTYLESRIRNC